MSTRSNGSGQMTVYVPPVEQSNRHPVDDWAEQITTS
jgi:hypothetical protein